VRNSPPGSLKSIVALVACAVGGWAYCGALIGIGRQFFSIGTTLVIHAIGAPVGFSAVSYFYHRTFPLVRPVVTAIVFLSIVVALDVFVVALLIESSFAMFQSFLGTWLPFLLIFVATYATGQAVRHGGPDRGAPSDG
jgi:hypothetical protein